MHGHITMQFQSVREEKQNLMCFITLLGKEDGFASQPGTKKLTLHVVIHKVLLWQVINLLMAISCEISTDRFCVCWQDSGLVSFFGFAWSQLLNNRLVWFWFRFCISRFCVGPSPCFQITDGSDWVPGSLGLGTNYWTYEDVYVGVTIDNCAKVAFISGLSEGGKKINTSKTK